MTDPLIGATTASFAVTLSVALTEPVDVAWSTKDGTAKAGIDYEAASGVVTFLPGETEKQIQVTVYGQDVGTTQPKNFYIKLTPPTNAVLGTSLIECIITVEDDEGTPITSIVVAQGKRGLKGDPGLSAYEQAVLMGYEGTVEEWMESTADAAQAATRAEANAARAEAAAAAAAFAGRIHPTPAAGVDPVTGVPNGAYYNVRSSSNDAFIDEYKNVNGVATPTGKSFPSSQFVQTISDYTALPFVAEKAYAINQRVQLANGDIVRSTVPENTNNPNVNMTGWVFDWADAVVPSINDLPTHAYDGMTVYVKSYHAGLGLGGGIRTYNSQRQQEDDGFLCIRGWVLQVHGSVTPEQAGCYGNGTADDAIGLQAVFSSGYKVVCRTGANYRTSKPIEMFNGQKIEGNRATITKFSGSKTGITGRLGAYGSLYNYDVDCAVVFAASNDYYAFIDINDLRIVKEKVLGADVGYVFYSPYICTSTLRNITVFGGEYGFWGADIWMISWERCAAYSKCGFYVGTGTSNTFNACWSKETKQGYSSFDFTNLIYSTMINCCAEAVGEDGKPAEAAYSFNSCDMTMISCAIEGIHAYNLVKINASRVSIDSPMFAINIHNKYRHTTRPALIYISTDPCVVNIRGGRVSTMDSGTCADAIHVVNSTLNCSGVLWWGLNLPNSSSASKKILHTQASIIDVTTFEGASYEYSCVAAAYKTVNLPVLFNGNIVSRGAGNTPLSAFRQNVNVYQQNSFANGSIANEYPIDSFAGVVLSLGGASNVGECVQVAASTYSPDLHYRTASFGSGFASWRKLYHSSNTTVDSNGFIKNASPIVQLFADKIEMNDEAQQQEIVLEKLGVGDYLLKGSTGFAQDGWYIETPKDANGNVLFSVIYTTLENGDISVKTYKKKFDIETASIVADLDSLVDINEGRWIDIRLNEIQDID